MYSVSTYLAKRAPGTIKSYKRALELFSAYAGTDVEHLEEYISTVPRKTLVEQVINFTDSELLRNLGQNTKRSYSSIVLAYLEYNEILIPKAQRKQAVPDRGDVFRDKAFTLDEVRFLYEFLSPIGRASVLLMLSTGMRLSEVCAFKESDIDGQIIHLKAKYCKRNKPRDVVMSAECQKYLTDVWLPQKPEYLRAAQNRNKGLRKGSEKRPERVAGAKSVEDARVIPVFRNTLYDMIMRAIGRAGLSEKEEGRSLYHPHSFRKSFRSIVGSQNPDLAELLMGHNGYLASSYLRLDILKDYKKVESLLTLGANESVKSKIDELMKENAGLHTRLERLEQANSVLQDLAGEGNGGAMGIVRGALTPDEIRAIIKQELEKAATEE